MDYKIIADSCCDLDTALKNKLNAQLIPLTMSLGNDEFTDDDDLDLVAYMNKMKQYKGRISSSCPSPGMFKEAFENAKKAFVITISSNLSGSYGSAKAAKEMAENAEDIHIFDSKSASAGEVLIALKLHKLISEGLSRNNIVEQIERFIHEMKTYFVLDNIDNLVKNGRLSKIKGTLISVLGIKPIMGSDGEGHIALYSNARGQNQIIERLTGLVAKSGKKTDGESMVITHCNNPSLAEMLMNSVRNRFGFKEVIILPTKGLSSMYANDKGIVMAF